MWTVRGQYMRCLACAVGSVLRMLKDTSENDHEKDVLSLFLYSFFSREAWSDFSVGEMIESSGTCN